jgi:hypothetical protein
MVVRNLTDAEREKYREVFENEFDSEVPREAQAHVFATDKAFVTLEYLLRAGLIWIDPSIRNTPEAISHLKELVTHLKDIVPPGQSVIAIASTEKEERLMRRMGMREISGTIFRYDA